MNDEKSFANGNGDSASGPQAPLWLRGNWELAEVWRTRHSSWTVQA